MILQPFGPFLEEWKPIKNYEDFYEISNYGRVKSFYRNKISFLKPNLSWGYYQVKLSTNKLSLTVSIHRLVKMEVERRNGILLSHQLEFLKNEALRRNNEDKYRNIKRGK